MSDVLARPDEIVRLALPETDDSHPLDWFDDSAPGDPLLPGVLTETSYTLPEGLNLGQWLKIGENLQRMERSVQWWLGDWWRYGERKYGDMASRAAREAIKDATGYSYTTIRHAGLVASKFENGRRRPNVPFAHHQEVASLPTAEADVILTKAESGELKRPQIREQVRHVQREIRAAEPKPEPDPSRIPPSVRIEWGDARAIPLDRDSVHLIVTSPPYSLDKPYSDGGDISPEEWRRFLYGALCDMLRVTVPSGRLALNVPLDTTNGGYRPLYSTAIQMAMSAGWLYRSTVVWIDDQLGKSTARGSVDSPSAPHIIAGAEMVALFSKGEWGQGRSSSTDLRHEEWIAWTNGVWRFPGETKPWEDHPAAFPIGLPHRLIKLLSFPGDVVLDPFCGSGTTAIAALKLGRQAIGYDRSQAYVDSALRRIAKEGFVDADRTESRSDLGGSDPVDAAGIRDGVREDEGAGENVSRGLPVGLHRGPADPEQQEFVQAGSGGLTNPFPPGTRVLIDIRGRRVFGTYLTIQDNGAGPVLGVDVTTNGGDRSIGTGMHWVDREQVYPLDPAGSSPSYEASEAEPDDDYPRPADLPCIVCGGEVLIADAETDRRIAAHLADGNRVELTCDGCEAEEAAAEDAVAGGM